MKLQRENIRKHDLRSDFYSNNFGWFFCTFHVAFTWVKKNEILTLVPNPHIPSYISCSTSLTVEQHYSHSQTLEQQQQQTEKKFENWFRWAIQLLEDGLTRAFLIQHANSRCCCIAIQYFSNTFWKISCNISHLKWFFIYLYTTRSNDCEACEKLASPHMLKRMRKKERNKEWNALWVDHCVCVCAKLHIDIEIATRLTELIRNKKKVKIRLTDWVKRAKMKYTD